jgi:hypothetical protein
MSATVGPETLLHRHRERLLDALAAILVVVVLAVLFALRRIDFNCDDAGIEYTPASREIARALGQGSLPWLARGAWYGGAFAGEYQYGVFNVFQLALDCVIWAFRPRPVQAAAAEILVYAAIMAVGAVRLARLRGLSDGAAVAAGCAVPFSGWLLSWGAVSWHPAFTSFAWMPWTVWAFERSVDRSRGPMRFVLPGVFVYLLVSTGWPFTDLMFAVMAALTVFKVIEQRRSVIAPWPIVAAAVFGVALAMPALLALTEYSRSTVRLAGSSPTFLWDDWNVPPAALPGFVLPSFSTTWTGMGRSWNKAAPELAGSMIPLAGLIAGMATKRGFARKNRWEIIGLIAGLLLCTGPGFLQFRWPFRWLPLVSFELAMVGASGLDAAAFSLSSVPPRIAGNAGLALALLLGIAMVRDLLRPIDPRVVTWELGPSLITVALGWGAWLGLNAARGLPERIAWSAPGALVVTQWLTIFYIPFGLSAFNCHQHFPSATRLAPFNHDVRYYIAMEFSELGLASDGSGPPAIARPGLSTEYADIDAINGYSPLGPLGVHFLLGIRPHGVVEPNTFKGLAQRESGRDGLLGLAGVDGLALSPYFADAVGGLVASGDWRVTSQSPAGTVLERAGGPTPRARCVGHTSFVGKPEEVARRVYYRGEAAAPIVVDGEVTGTFVDFAPCTIDELHDERLRSEATVSVAPSGEALLVFARPWLPGWQASLDGRPIPVQRVDVLFPAVRLPAGAHGRVVLRYFPDSIEEGLVCAGGALSIVLCLAGLTLARRRSRAG